ncbi:hypothetical protein NLJ89_g6930 [Agrocybe chaxingu]|uniref:Uncharacterized protein n=1 Tax=Agrocybe chaxingu TaxID=84603 RepID=A0A9W8JY91_9AGAR|nr:hypothetical protein NLJ89_g6930 [Agrocybe chaxingu]
MPALALNFSKNARVFLVLFTKILNGLDSDDNDVGVLEDARDIATHVITVHDDVSLNPWTLRSFVIEIGLSASRGVLAEIHYFKPLLILNDKFEVDKTVLADQGLVRPLLLLPTQPLIPPNAALLRRHLGRPAPHYQPWLGTFTHLLIWKFDDMKQVWNWLKPSSLKQIGHELFAIGKRYQFVALAYLIGFLVPIPFWIAHKLWPKLRSDYLYTPVIWRQVLILI